MRLITLSISILLLTGCFGRHKDKEGPLFQVGECIASQSDLEKVKEEWESPEQAGPDYVHKIIQVGYRKYRVLTYSRRGAMVYKSDHEFKYDYIMKKIECPVELNSFYE